MYYDLHPLCTFFPRLTDSAFSDLVDDIRVNGLRQPIVLHDGMILDGGNRYRACIEAGIEPSFVEYIGNDIVLFVLSANLHRRHLTPGQRASIVASAQNWAKAHPPHRIKEGCHVAPFDTVTNRQALSGASERTQQRADKVAKADPDMARKVIDGEISLPKALKKITAKTEDEESFWDEAEKKDEADLPTVGPEYTEADELRDRVEALQDMLAVRGAPDDEREMTEMLIAGLRKEIKTLTATLAAAESSRDMLMRENAALKKQCLMQAKKIKMLEPKK